MSLVELELGLPPGFEEEATELAWLGPALGPSLAAAGPSQLLLVAGRGLDLQRTTLVVATASLEEPDAGVVVRGLLQVLRPRTSTDGQLLVRTVRQGPVLLVADVVEVELDLGPGASDGTAVVVGIAQCFLPLPAAGGLLVWTLASVDLGLLEPNLVLVRELAERTPRPEPVA